ncbi:hypothetical protein CASFOL_024241 [Castilleja foliolosa]|uniref:Uncharacterized protein n=1 Tax=Castilleja foliolosa TaxID=1961234 RepID=A0ABD3CNU1_9LAMI
MVNILSAIVISWNQRGNRPRTGSRRGHLRRRRR